MSTKFSIRAALSVLALSTCCAGMDQVFVSTHGVKGAAGLINSPTDLESGLARLGPGVILWLRGGTYHVRSGITISRGGTAEKPAIIRNYNGERVSIDGGTGATAAISIAAEHVWVWGLDIFSSDPIRISRERGAFPSDIQRVTAVGTAQTAGGGRGFKLINFVVRDGFNGIGLWKEAVDAEIYGNLIFNNGWEGADKGWNHGIYTQNQTGTKKIAENVIFNQFSHGIHAYGSESAWLDNIHLEGNILFNNGGLSVREGFARNILVGGGRVARNPVLIDNYTYYPPSARDGSNDVGYAAGCSDLLARGNFFVGPVALRMVRCANASVEGNTFYGALTGFSPSTFPNNRYISSRPENWIFLRRNRYEARRANIVVYNWSRSDYVEVDAGAVLRNGDVWEVRDVQDYFGEPVAKGIYSGERLRIPMRSHKVMQPVGTLPMSAVHTDQEFGAFVLLGQRGDAATTRAEALSAQPRRSRRLVR